MWELIKNLSELLKFLAILLALSAVAYWWWVNRKRRWWIWQVGFYPAQVNRLLVNQPEGVPLALTLRFLMVNISLLPKVVTDVSFTLLRLSDGLEVKFAPYALMGSLAFSRPNTKWKADWQELFRPLVIKERGYESFNLLFLPADASTDLLLPGKYRSTVTYQMSQGKPISISFSFPIDEDEVNDFTNGVPFGKLQRNLPVA